MSQLHCVVDLRLSEPGLLVPGGEDLDSHALPHPGSPPHLPIPAFAWKQSDTVSRLQSHGQSRAKEREQQRRGRETHRHTPQERSVWPSSSGPGRAALSHCPMCRTHQRSPRDRKRKHDLHVTAPKRQNLVLNLQTALTPYVGSSPLGTFSAVTSWSSTFLSLQ